MAHGVELLADPVAERLLGSTNPARLAYNWTDGTVRVVPICFHWDGSAMYFATQPHAPKIKALTADPRIAVTIDGVTFPYEVLLLRGNVRIDFSDGMVPEYAAAVHRYMGPELATGWLAQLEGQPMAKITFRPDWVTVLDFQTRFPSAMGA